MKTKAAWLAGIIVTVALGLAFSGAPLAQTTTSVDKRDFEIISVDGNKLVVRDQKGTNEYTVPDDFRFTVDGKKLAVSDLKAGMKGTATITTTTTVKPVVVTQLREAEVLRASDLSMTVREGDAYNRYTQGQLDAKGIQIYKDGKPIRLADVRRGDRLTGTIVTTLPPEILTEKEVQATLAEAKGDAATTPKAANTATAPAAAPAAPSPAPAPPPAPPAEASGLGTMGYVIIAAIIALALFFFMRRKKAP